MKTLIKILIFCAFALSLKAENNYMNLSAMQTACEMNKAEACLKLGDFYHNVKNQDYNLAFKFYSKSCDLGNYRACSELGNSYIYGEGVEQNRQKGLELFARSCEMKESFGCLYLANDYHASSGGDDAPNYQKAFEFYTKSCDLNNKKACAELGGLYMYGFGVQKDYQKAFEYFNDACSETEASGCIFLGRMYEDGLGAKKNISKSIKFYNHACDLDSEEGCSYLADLYFQMKGKENINKAEKLYKKSCDLGNGDKCIMIDWIQSVKNEILNKQNECLEHKKAEACLIFAMIYDKAVWQNSALVKERSKEWSNEDKISLKEILSFVDNDPKKADEFYAQACEIGGEQEDWSCFIVTLSYAFQQNYNLQNKFANKLCDLGGELGASGCYLLGYNYDLGLGVPKDYKMTQSLYQKACELDNSNCEYYGLSYLNPSSLDYEQARINITKACKADNEEACNLQIYFIKPGNDFIQNTIKTQKLCNEGDFKACHAMGYFYAARKIYSGAFDSFSSACEQGQIADACFNLSDLYDYGLGTKKDRQKALDCAKKGVEYKKDEKDKEYVEIFYNLAKSRLSM